MYVYMYTLMCVYGCVYVHVHVDLDVNVSVCVNVYASVELITDIHHITLHFLSRLELMKNYTKSCYTFWPVENYLCNFLVSQGTRARVFSRCQCAAWEERRGGSPRWWLPLFFKHTPTLLPRGSDRLRFGKKPVCKFKRSSFRWACFLFSLVIGVVFFCCSQHLVCSSKNSVPNSNYKLCFFFQNFFSFNLLVFGKN